MEEALQWWHKKKLRQLESEANLIREQLLQESFAMRRSLELSSIESDKLVGFSTQKYLEQLENFHCTLQEISDRLSPPYLNEGLPWALQYLIKTWQEQFTSCQFDFQLPENWHQKERDTEYIILNLIEELFHLKLTNSVANQRITLILKQESVNSLKIIFYPKNRKTKKDNEEKKQKYLQKSFQYLTLGICKIEEQKNCYIWNFSW